MHKKIVNLELLLITMAIAAFVFYSCKNKKTVTGRDFMDDLSGNVESVEEETKRAFYELKVWQQDPVDTLYYPVLKNYDKDGNILTEQQYSMGQLYDAVVYEYKNGKLNRFLEFGPDKKLNHVNQVTEIEAGFRVLKMVTSSVSGHLDNDTTAFSWKDKRIVKVTATKQKGYAVIEYNDKGHRTKVTSYDSLNKVKEQTSYEYLAFDDAGNWTKRASYNSANPGDYPFIQVRKIKYY